MQHLTLNKPNKYECVNFEEQRNEDDRHHNDDPRQREKTHVAAEHARYCPGCADRRLSRGGVGEDMRERRHGAAEEIKHEVATGAQPLLDGRR